jgi:hypothetical protein
MQAKRIIKSFENWEVGLLEAKITTSTDFYKQIQTQAQCQQRGCTNFQVLLLSQTIQVTLVNFGHPGGLQPCIIFIMQTTNFFT